MNLIAFGLVAPLGWQVDQLEDEGSSGYDAAAAREEVSADDILEYGGFTR